MAAVAEVSLYLLQLRFELEFLCGWSEFLLLLEFRFWNGVLPCMGRELSALSLMCWSQFPMFAPCETVVVPTLRKLVLLRDLRNT